MSTNKESLQLSYSQPGYTINWGAILAGLVFILALGWLMFTLSSAIGLSIVDIENIQANNVETKAKSLGMATIVWVFITAIVTYFLGGFLSGKVSGRSDKPTGTLHGLVLWSCTIILGIILGALGVSGIINTATGAAKSVTSSAMSATAILASQSNSGSSDRSSFLHPLVGSLKQGLTKAIEKTEKALENSNNDSVSSKSQRDKESNRSNNSERLSDDNSNKSSEKATSKSVNSQEKPITSSVNDQDNDRKDNEDAVTHSQSDSSDKDSYEQSQNEVADAAPQSKAHETNKNGHYDLKNSDKSSAAEKHRRYHHHYQQLRSTTKRVEKAVKNIDSQILALTAVALIQGDKERAKEILSSHIDIDEAEIDTIIQNVQERAIKAGKELKAKAEDAKEYAAGVLWIVFISYLFGLIAAVLGAQMAMRVGNTFDHDSSKNLNKS